MKCTFLEVIQSGPSQLLPHQAVLHLHHPRHSAVHSRVQHLHDLPDAFSIKFAGNFFVNICGASVGAMSAAAITETTNLQILKCDHIQ